MASIFTYDPDPPSVSSPWLQDFGIDFGNAELHSSAVHSEALHTQSEALSRHEDVNRDRKVTRLQAEPQEGPVEYKLHLLLRPRRKFRSTSTGSQSPGSLLTNFGVWESDRSLSSSAVAPMVSPSPPVPFSASVQQTRQHRLEQLTTQLLWRLQQSSPHHTSSATNIILPSLPEALPELAAPQQPAKLLHGLEESQGALYEIGVSDDGTLVGLAEDELKESLNNLRAMAACLGCTVEVLRKEVVGECEWVEDVVMSTKDRRVRRAEKLVVAEAFVKPYLHAKGHTVSLQQTSADGSGLHDDLPGILPATTEQLRITLTGPTMSGKSSLLGTLTTSTLDNGRGKSRISMLKHRHEITSGITSSVTQELLGYQEAEHGNVEIINYSRANIASWIDIHVAASGSRLVFMSDSAGHPRYRRTTVRGLVGWAPHWTFLCIPADDTDDTGGKTGVTHASQQHLGSAVSDIDLSGAQLDLCLRLKLPLVIVITKLDLASRTGLRKTLTKILNTLKSADRKPAILPNGPGTVTEHELHEIEGAKIETAYTVSLPLLNDLLSTVPIVLTSVVQGTGIKELHALLHELPIPDIVGSAAGDTNAVFYIEDVYGKPAAGLVVSGRLSAGRISVGDVMVLGPSSMNDHLEDSEDSDERLPRKPSSRLPTSRSFPGALRDSHLTARYFQLPNQEWRRVKVLSIRNLRHPVHSLVADQIGTIAIVPHDFDGDVNSSATLTGIRKGMVLAIVQPLATRTFVAEFKREDLEALAVGNHVVTYIASVRASAKIVSARAPDSPVEARQDSKRESLGQDAFAFDELALALNGPYESVAGAVTAPNLWVTFRFDATKEYVRVDDQVLVMPGGGSGLSGLDGFVGIVKEAHG